MSRISVFASTTSYTIVPDRQADVQLLAVRRVDSQGNLCALDRVVNRPVTTVSEQTTPSAPPLPHADFRADFAGGQSADHGTSSLDWRHDARPASHDTMTSVDYRWGPPPLYSARDTTSHRSQPGVLPPPYEAPPAYTPFDVLAARGMRVTRV